MIYALARGVDVLLAAKRFPVRVVYGPELMGRAVGDGPLIVVERDRQSGDAFDPSMGAPGNPRQYAVRMMGVRAVVWARSSLAGARIEEHEDQCDQFVDGFYCAARDWIAANIHYQHLPLVESRYMTAAEQNEIQTWPGVAYVLRFRVPRAVRNTDFQGAGLPVVAAPATTGEVRITRNASTDPPEVVNLPNP